MVMFVNQLSPGDKMSLKGKIFELQKKLNLLDVEQQNTEEYSFHPEITQYKLPNREENFIQNINQAEETRKGRFEALKKQLTVERSQDCSFVPQINNRKIDQAQRKGQKPVHIRLTEKGKEYQDSAEKRKQVSVKMICVVSNVTSFICIGLIDGEISRLRRTRTL